MIVVSDPRRLLYLLSTILLLVVPIATIAIPPPAIEQSAAFIPLLFITVLAILLLATLTGFIYSGIRYQWLPCLIPFWGTSTMNPAMINRKRFLRHFYWYLTLIFCTASLTAVSCAHLWLENRHQQHRNYTEAVSEAHLNTLSQSLTEAFSSAYTLGLLVKQSNGKLDDFDTIAHEMLATTPGLAALQLVPDGVITATVPRTGNEAATHHNLMTNKEQLPAVLKAMETGQLTVSGPFDLLQGGVGAIARQSVYLNDNTGTPRFWGLTAALIRFPDILNNIGLDQLANEGIAYRLWHYDTFGQQQVIFHSGNMSSEAPLTLPVIIPNGEWMLSVEPVGGWLSAEHTTIAGLLGGLFVMLVMSVAASLLYQPVRLQEEVAARTRELAESETRFRTFFENNRSVMMLVEPDTGVIRQANEAACKFYGYSIDELYNCPISAINVMGEEKLKLERHKAMAEEKNCFQFIHRLRDGSIRHVEVYSTPVNIGDSKKLFSIIHDVTERHNLESENRLAASVFTHANEAIVVMDNKHRIIRTNSAFHSITGVHLDDIDQHSLLRTMNVVNEDESALWEQVRRHGNWKSSVWGIRPNDSSYAALLTISTVRNKDDSPHNYIALFSDITSIKAHEKELEDMANFDSLTRLPNRALFLDRLRIELDRHSLSHNRVAVLFLDLDDFKIINDSWGHTVGDQVLDTIASRLRTSIRENDTVARIGGDEFLLILTHLPQGDLCGPVLKRLLTSCAAPIPSGSKELSLSASIGISFFPDNGQYPEQLIRQADYAMYQSKKQGRNRCTYFTEEDSLNDSPASEKIKGLEYAINNQQLQVYYQPKVNLNNGEVSGFEALIRWQHPENGLLNPVTFIEELEGHDVFVKMDNWVLKSVFEHLSAWNAQGFHTSVAVNVSAMQLQNPNFPVYIRDLLAAHPDITPGQIEFEILESSALRDLSSVSEIVLEFSAIGIEFSLDDFGTGFSTLERLQQLPVKALKIDTGFVLDMLHNTSSLRLVKAILALSDAFNLKTVAEGIEDIELGETLIRLGCQYGQGYGIARPMPMEQALSWYQSWQYPESWRLASEDKNGPDESILIAEVEHRTWMRMFFRHCNDDPSKLPEMNSSNCNFGRWCQEIAYAEYSSHPLFTDVVSTHHELHIQARELLNQPLEKRDVKPLEQTSQKLLSLLRRLPIRDNSHDA